MIPKKDKSYEINYESKEEDTSYNGIGTYLGETSLAEDNSILYLFSVPDNILYGWFGEENIVRELFTRIKMKTNISVSKDGINLDEFKDVEFLELDSFSQKDQKKFVENYATSALTKLAEVMINLKIKVSISEVRVIYDIYRANITDYCLSAYRDRTEAIFDIERELSLNQNSMKIDNIIAILRGTKPFLRKEHKSQYLYLKNLVLKNCQLDDNSVI